VNACKVKFVRTSGLGNRLFPWARCTIFSKKNEIPMVPPVWPSYRRGPLFRGGVDYQNFLRKILLFDNFHASEAHLGKLNAFIFPFKSNEIYFNGVGENDNSYFEELLKKGTSPQNCLFVFSGDSHHFADLKGNKEFLKSELYAITKLKWIRFVEGFSEFPIGLNIRVGKDFKEAKSPKDYFSKGAIRTPLSWYKETLIQVRQHLGDLNAPAFIATDGTEKELADILEMPNVKLIKTKSAICDLLLMAKSKIFIGSGGSSFSAWVSFLGGMPTVTHPGQSLDWFQVSKGNPGQFVGEFDPENPNYMFLKEVEKFK
jgi:hypothetical protein